VADALTIKGGGEYRTYSFDTFGFQQAVSQLSGADRATDVTNLGPDRIDQRRAEHPGGDRPQLYRPRYRQDQRLSEHLR
jgi:iron complex outermembrane receptor protein